MINIKTNEEIKIMKEGGKIAAQILNIISKEAKAGVTTDFLDKIAQEKFKYYNAKASFLGYADFPKSICTSVNSQVVHGIPDKYLLKEGDILGIDIGVYFNGFHTDTAITVGIGKIDFRKKELIKICLKSLTEGVSIIKPGIHLGDIQNRIQSIAEGAGFSIIRDLAGHGIGKNLQENPSISNFGKKNTGLILKPGMVLAIEPMISSGDFHVKILSDGWTVETVDKSLSAHFEHTVAVTNTGYEILTKL